MIKKNLQLSEYRRFKKVKFGNNTDIEGNISFYDIDISDILSTQDTVNQNKPVQRIDDTYSFTFMTYEELENIIDDFNGYYLKCEFNGCKYIEEDKSFQVSCSITSNSNFAGSKSEVIFTFKDEVEYHNFCDFIDSSDGFHHGFVTICYKENN